MLTWKYCGGFWNDFPSSARSPLYASMRPSVPVTFPGVAARGALVGRAWRPHGSGPARHRGRERRPRGPSVRGAVGAGQPRGGAGTWKSGILRTCRAAGLRRVAGFQFFRISGFHRPAPPAIGESGGHSSLDHRRMTTFPKWAPLARYSNAAGASSKPNTRSTIGLSLCCTRNAFMASKSSREPT